MDERRRVDQRSGVDDCSRMEHWSGVDHWGSMDYRCCGISVDHWNLLNQVGEALMSDGRRGAVIHNGGLGNNGGLQQSVCLDEMARSGGSSSYESEERDEFEHVYNCLRIVLLG